MPLVKHNAPHVSIIIVNWNGKTFLKGCLESLKIKTSYPDYDVIVVDNASEDDSLLLLHTQFPWVHVISNAKNLGFSIGNNIGIEYAIKKFRSHLFLLLNNDVEIIETDWLNKLVNDAYLNPKIGIVGCKLLFGNHELQHIGVSLSYAGPMMLSPKLLPPKSGVYRVDGILGACFMIKKETIDAIGLLDPEYSPFQHEESDYCARAKFFNLLTIIDTDVSVIHFFNQSMKKLPSTFWWYINQRNEIRFAMLNMPLKWIGVWFSLNLYRSLKRLKLRISTSENLEPKKIFIEELYCYMRAWHYNLHRLHDIANKRASRMKKTNLSTK